MLYSAEYSASKNTVWQSARLSFKADQGVSLVSKLWWAIFGEVKYLYKTLASDKFTTFKSSYCGNLTLSDSMYIKIISMFLSNLFAAG